MIRIFFALVFLLTYHSVAFAQLAITNTARHVQQGNAYLLRSQFSRAINSYDIALKLPDLSSDKRAAILSDRGVAQWRLKVYDKALADFTASLENKVDYPQALNNRGNVHLEMGNIEAALMDFDKAVIIAPDYGISYINRGNAYYLSNNFESAHNDFERAMRLLPTQAIAYHASGLSNIALDRKYAALRNLNRALILNKAYKSALLNRSKVYEELDFTKEALDDLSVSIRNNPEDQTLLIKRARLRLSLKQYYAVINDAQKALKLAPGLVDAHILRGVAYGKIKKYKSAFKDLNKAIEDDPDRVESYIRRGALHKRRGAIEKAKVDFNTALELTPKNPEIYQLLGQISETEKEDEQALSFYKRALGLDPLDAESREGIKRLTGTLPDVNGTKIGNILENWQILNIAKRVEVPVKAEAVKKGAEGTEVDNAKASVKTEAKAKKAEPKDTVKPHYILLNADYPNFSAPLEMYGTGEPHLLEWTALKKPLSGFGLLRYFAGYQDEEQQIGLEYIGIVNFKNNSLIAVEPYKWGDKVAKWSWRQVSVVVTDPNGISSEVFLKKSGKSRIASKGSSVRATSFKASPRSREKARIARSKRERKRRKRRKKNNGIFDWLF